MAVCVRACVLTHHWKLVEVQQLFDEASEHVLTLPHLIQGPENTGRSIYCLCEMYLFTY